MRTDPRLLIALFACCTALIVTVPAGAHANSFVVACASDHIANDDPIVFPGKPGASHRHEFFGAKGVTASSTDAQLRRSPTTCAHKSDTASYWAPTLEVSGKLVRAKLHAYYERAGKPSAAAPPAGLRMIAGDMHALVSQSMHVTSWQCRGPKLVSAETRTITKCRAGQQLAAWVRFPDCWNGRTLDSTDHKSHVTRSAKGKCPTTHPVAMMRVSMLLTWPVRPASADAVTLGAGKLTSIGLHADFWNTWHQPTLTALRWQCIEVAKQCGEVRT